MPPVPRSAPDGAARPLSVGEYVAQVTAPGPTEPGFGEWPYGKRKADPVRDDEPVGPNPYLPCEEAPPEVRLAPGGLPGTLALLAGLAGLGLALFPIIAIAVWPLTILGLVLGVVGLRRIRAGSARNSVAAVSGIVLSMAGLALCVAWLSMYAMAGVGTAGRRERRTRTGIRPPSASSARYGRARARRSTAARPRAVQPVPGGDRGADPPRPRPPRSRLPRARRRDLRPPACGVPHGQRADASGLRDRLVRHGGLPGVAARARRHDHRRRQRLLRRAPRPGLLAPRCRGRPRRGAVGHRARPGRPARRAARAPARRGARRRRGRDVGRGAQRRRRRSAPSSAAPTRCCWWTPSPRSAARRWRSTPGVSTRATRRRRSASAHRPGWPR